MPFISIIVPIYNSAEYLPRCIQSILSQDYDGLELILVDDGSTDGSGALAERFRRDNVKVIHKENGGAASARQAGLEIAGGKYVWFVDSDDAIEEDALEEIDEVLHKTPDIDIFRFGFKYCKGTSYQPESIPYREGIYTGKALEALRHRIVLDSGKLLLTQCMQIYRRAFLDGIPFVSERQVFEEDKIHSILANLRAQSVYLYCEYFYRYYKHENSLSTANEPLLRKCLAAYRYLKEQLTEMGIWDDYKTDISASYLYDSILGGGEKRNGCVFQEYLYNRDNPRETVKEALESAEVLEMLENTAGLKLSPQLEALRKFAEEKDEAALCRYLLTLARS